MNRLIKHAIAAVGLVAGITLFGVPNVQGAETIPIDPAALPRGANTRLPHIEGNEIVDGTTRIPVEGTDVELVGKTPYGYVTSTRDPESGPKYIIWDFALVTSTKSTPLASGVFPETDLSSDGTLLAYTSFTPDDTEFVVVEVATGKTLASAYLKGQRGLVAVEGQNVYVSGVNGMVRWNYASGQVRATTQAPVLDPAHHLFAGTGPDGCTALRQGEDPKPIWSSCTEQIVAFNQTGNTFATKGSGDESNVIRMRGLGGALQATFPVDGFVSKTVFESPGTLLLDVRWWSDSTTNHTVVRAWRTGANRATAIESD